MPNFADSRASVRVTSLEQEAKNIARNNNQSITNVQAIPQNVIDSMTQQGMMNQSAWSPGTPIDPVQPVGSEPRQYEYIIGQNIVQRPRSTEDVGFDTIRSIIEMYDVAQMCIEVRQDELRNLDWDIVPEDEDDAKKYESEIKQVREFFTKPDGYMLFDDFQNMLAYDWLAFDALTIFPHLTKGGKLGALEVVDGTTITPLVDYYGRIPMAPAPAYVQWINGMPWTWQSRDQLIYRPHRKRSNKLYGFTPVEWLLNNINTDIRYQIYFLQFFTDGNIPDSWINAPEQMSDPKQIETFEQMYNAVMTGDQRRKHQIRMIPFGSKVQQAKEVKWDTGAPHFFLTKTCAAFKVTPAEIGFTEKVNKSSGETQENVQYRRSINPSARYFESIYTGIIHQFFGLPNLKFKYLNLDEQEDLLLMAQRDEIYIKNGVISPDEVRVERLGFDVDATNPVPRMFISTSTMMTVDDAVKQSNATVAQIQAQTEATLEQAEQTEQRNGESGITPQGEQEQEHPEITSTVVENENSQKAMMDFFVSPAKRSIQTRKSKDGSVV